MRATIRCLVTDTLRDLVTLTFDLLTLVSGHTWRVTWSSHPPSLKIATTHDHDIRRFVSRPKRSPSICNQPIRPTQPSTLSGTENEYRPKCGDALWLGQAWLIPFVDARVGGR